MTENDIRAALAELDRLTSDELPGEAIPKAERAADDFREGGDVSEPPEPERSQEEGRRLAAEDERAAWRARMLRRLLGDGKKDDDGAQAAR